MDQTPAYKNDVAVQQSVDALGILSDVEGLAEDGTISLATDGFDPVSDLGTFASAVGLVSDTLGFAAGIAAQDPPDPNYQTVFVPQQIVGPALDPQGVSPAFAQTFTTSASDLDQAVVDLNAVGVTANRYSSAIAAGDTYSASIQYLAFLQYLGEYNTAANGAGSSFSQLAGMLQSQGIGMAQPTGDNISGAQAALQSTGAATPGLYQYFETQGFTDTQIRQMIDEAVSSTPTIPQESITQSLADLSSQLLNTSVNPNASTSPQSPTTTTLSSSNNPATISNAVTFTATVTGSGTSPTGTVTFSDGSTDLGAAGVSSGVATLTVSSLPTGTNLITASYGGDSNNLASSSATFAQTVNPVQDIAALLSGPARSSVVSSQRLTLKERLTLSAKSVAVKGGASWSVLLSPDETNGSSVETLESSAAKLNLKPDGKFAANLKLPKTIPASVAPGTYHVLLDLTDTEGAVATLDSGQTITVAAPVVDLTGVFSKVPAVAKPGKVPFTFVVTNTSSANIPAMGLLPYYLYTSPDGELNDSTSLTSGKQRISLKPGQSQKITISAVIDTTAYLVADLDPFSSAFPNDIDVANKVFSTAQKILVQ